MSEKEQLHLLKDINYIELTQGKIVPNDLIFIMGPDVLLN